MGVPECANHKSRARGLEYFENKRIKSCEKTELGYCGVVVGQKEYEVEINLAHPKKSTCTCAFKQGRNVVCKHMVALFYAAHPLLASELIDQRKREQKRIESLEYRIEEYVNSLSIDELRVLFVRLLLEWRECVCDDDEWSELYESGEY